MPEQVRSGNSPGSTNGSGTLARPAGRDGSFPSRVRRIFGDEIDRLRAGLLSDLGGQEAVTTGELMLLNATLEAHAIRRLLGHRILCRGACDRKGGVKPAVLSYFTALNSERLNLVALGLRRRARRIDSYVAGLLEHEATGGHKDGDLDSNKAEDSASDSGGRA